MKRPSYAVLLAAALLPGWVSGQIQLGLSVGPSPALHHEFVTVHLNVQNNTGDPLDLGTNGNTRVRYVLRDQRGQLATRWEGDGYVTHELVIPASLMGGVTNALDALYRLDAGSYAMEAEVRWGDLVFVSEKKYLEIVPGVTIAEMESGIPGGRGTRHFALKVLNRERQEHLFLRIDDKALSRCLGVVDLGRYLRMETPVMRVDGSGYLHVLHQSGPYDHVYSVVSPNGEVDRSSAYSGEYKVVRLKTMNDGSVEVNESISGELPTLRQSKSDAKIPLGWKDRRSPPKK